MGKKEKKTKKMTSSTEKQTVRMSGSSEKQTVRRMGSSENELSIWRFDRIDRNGKFAFDIGRSDFQHKEFLDKLISYSSMTWGEIRNQTHDGGKSKHHFLSFDSLSKSAQDRILALHMEEDMDRIYSFTLQNKLRIIGLRDNSEFHVLWYDPTHEVCISKKRNT